MYDNCRKIFVFIVFIFLILKSYSQNKLDKYFISLQPEYGGVVAHHEEIKPLSLYNFPNIEFSFYKQTTGENLWEKKLNYPQSGISFLYSSLSNKNVFGRAFSIMPFRSFTFFRREKFEQRFVVSAGLGLLTKPFDSITNIKNIAYGSYLNASIKFQYNFLYKINNLSSLSIGGSFLHYSNGAIKYPNWGLNVLSVSAAYHKKINKTPIIFTEPSVVLFEKKWKPYLWGAYGIKQNSEKDKNLYNAYSLGFGCSRAYKDSKEWMVEANIFYDITDKIEANHYLLYPSDFDILKIGLIAGHEWSIDRLSCIVQIGYYLKIYNKNEFSNRIYNRMALRYRLFNSLYSNISIKAHYAKADYIEWGLLYKFNEK